MMIKRAFVVLALASAVVSAQAVNLIQNGSFETSTNGTVGQFITLANGDTSITGWTVGGAGIDYIGTYWTAQDGDFSLDLSATAAGSISQSFATAVGQQYKVDFYLAGNGALGGGTRVTLVSAGAVVGQSFNSTANNGNNPMSWELNSLVFTATGNLTTLTFASNENSATGPALDNVSVEAVPEPITVGLVLAGLGAAVRRRNRR